MAEAERRPAPGSTRRRKRLAESAARTGQVAVGEHGLKANAISFWEGLALALAWYALTGFACGIYYRREIPKTLRNLLFIGLAPAIGATPPHMVTGGAR
jgi:hypothetical protein